MPDFRMLNGNQKGTAIVRFDRTAVLIVRGKKKEFIDVEELKKFKERKKIETNIEHIHPASIRTERTREWNIPLPEKGFFSEMMGVLFRTA